ncbi:hypothetical protein ACFL08_00590 [Patescibacteria group bacterium]
MTRPFLSLYSEERRREGGFCGKIERDIINFLSMRFLEITKETTAKSWIFLGVFTLASLVLFGFIMWAIERNTGDIVKEYEQQSERAKIRAVELEYKKLIEQWQAEFPDEPALNLLPPNMQRMKRQGCVVDGILNRANKETREKSVVELVNRSSCYYLHRSIETWLSPPDFEEIEKTMGSITKNRDDVLYGMFIAEAIDTKAIYLYETENREFEFNRMCRSGSKNFWGEHTCKPSLGREEYRLYVLDITKKAMDLGVQSFMFGQIYFQDYITNSSAEQVLREMRAYAKFKGIEIVIGAQTNDINDEKYLRQFDFIEGGIGISPKGEIEKGPCYSRWWKKKGDWCWALLWNKKFSKKANNVFVHLDWSGIEGDDMGTFAHMSRKKRAETLRYLEGYFSKKDVGFLMPILTPLYKENGGCYGKSRKYYSADNRHSCKDENVINELLSR